MTAARRVPFWVVITGLAIVCAAVVLLSVRVAPVPEHLHVHLTITVDGVEHVVPANVGISAETGVTQPLHTHDTSGIVHVESAVQRSYTLGDFFADSWREPLSSTQVGSFATSSAETLTVFVDGTPIQADPASIVFTNKMDIDLVFSPVGTPAIASAPFDWPPQY